ncbi:MAG TPA: apolipoprotein N-acyltransferase, partial [Bacteroidota bacterium]|nr:apolipoprotein N-acyltransferase [Bacteroidota bacterium]
MSGALLGVAYPPLPFGIVAAVAFVPFFLLFEEITTYGEALRLSYGVFFVFNLITLYWTGGFTHAKDIYLMSAGTAVLVFHPMFSWAAIVPWMFVRKRLGNLFAVCAFPFVWVVYEWVRSLTEYSFPWLTLGNTQTYNLPVAQMVQWTGVYGISFWLLCLNVLLYLFANGIARKRWKLASPETLGVLGCIIIVYSLPQLYGYSVLKHARPESSGGNPIRIGIVQPNIDPFEKWTGPVPKEIAIQESMTVVAAKSKASLILWSETGIPQAVLTPYHAAEFADLRSLIDSLHTNFLTGYIGMVVYPQHGPYPKSSKISIDGARYDEFNSALLVRWNSPDTQKYNKILLVPYAERVPYSEFLSFLNAMQWNFGLG